MKKLAARLLLAAGLAGFVLTNAQPAEAWCWYSWGCFDSCNNLAWACSQGDYDPECWQAVTDCHAYCDTIC